jgi:magnesium transporter
MQKTIKRRSAKSGKLPGTLIHIGEQRIATVRIRVIEYDADHLEERQLTDLANYVPDVSPTGVTWINVVGLHQVEVLDRLGASYAIHPLVLEDILNTDQRPKVEEGEGFLCFILKNLAATSEPAGLAMEQVSIVLGRQFVLSFLEEDETVFAPVIEYLKAGKGRIRKSGPDYLAYALLDAVVDNYFVVLEGLGERLERLEDLVMGKPAKEALDELHRLKRDMIMLRRVFWPLREAVGVLQRHESDLVDHATGIYLRDLYDHVVQVIDTVETYRDMLSGMLDIYLSSMSNRLNEVMKILTIYSTIFIPLTFIAGVYGMNFKLMPELEWRWGYPAVLGVMASVALGMLVFFKRKRWF